MSTELKSHAQGVSLTRFWGGDKRGSCVQLTQKKQQLPATADKFFDSVQLTRAQAAAIAADLLDFAQGRAMLLFCPRFWYQEWENSQKSTMNTFIRG